MKVKMIFEVIVNKDMVIDDKTLKEEYGGDIKKICQFLYKEEGHWWNEEMKLVDASVILEAKTKL